LLILNGICNSINNDCLIFVVGVLNVYWFWEKLASNGATIFILLDWFYAIKFPTESVYSILN